ncbi:MAG: response regulator [Nitrospira sp.]
MADDDNDDWFLVEDALRRLGRKDIISFVADGEELLAAMEAAYETNSLPSVIVLDLNMPRMDGIETLKQLKQDERFSSIPVIIYTTSVNTAEKEQCMLLGAAEYIIKRGSFEENIKIAGIFLTYADKTAD